MAVSLEFIWPNLLLSIHFTLVEEQLYCKGLKHKIDVHLPVKLIRPTLRRTQRPKELQQNSLFQKENGTASSPMYSQLVHIV